MLPPKASHHAKFHRDRSNQLEDKGWSEKNFNTQTDTRHPDWLSRASQHARGATKKKKKNIGKIHCMYSPSGKFAKRAK